VICGSAQPADPKGGDSMNQPCENTFYSYLAGMAAKKGAPHEDAKPFACGEPAFR